MTCPNCGHEVIIDQHTAETFYNKKILSYFHGLYGCVLDLGCGGGFLSRYLIQNHRITKIFGLDADPDCASATEDIDSRRFTFVLADLGCLGKRFKSGSIDFLVSRDVFMFVEDTDRYFDVVTAVVTTGIRQMGWYKKDSRRRMRNRLEPQQIAGEYEKRGWKVRLDYLDWYKSGYFIQAFK